MYSAKNLSSETIHNLALKLGVSPTDLSEVLSFFSKAYKVKSFCKNGKRRTIYDPCPKLKKIQKRIGKVVLAKLHVLDSMHGYCKKRSTITNAKRHIGKLFIAKYDIKNFFPSIHFSRVFELFKQVGFTEDEAEIFTRLNTVHYCLPHGFVNSPKIAVILLTNVAKRLGGAFEKVGLEYTFYSDDITISGNFKIKGFENLVKRIFNQEGFKINTSKIEYLRKDESKIVTGWVVNEKVNILRKEKDDLSAIVHKCLIHSPETQIDEFWDVYGESRRGIKNLKKFKERLYGKIVYLKKVRPNLFNKLNQKFNQIAWLS